MSTLATGATVLVRQDGAAARVTLNRPDKRNALSLELMRELLAALRRVSAEEAAAIGFARVVPATQLDGAVEDLARSLAAKSSAVLRLGRGAFYAVWDQAAADALRLLHPMLTVHTGLEDAAEGIAAFAEKRDPTWKDA